MAKIDQVVFGDNKEIKCSVMPLTTYDPDSDTYATIRPQPPLEQYLVTHLYGVNDQQQPRYSKIGFKEGTLFGDLYVRLASLVKEGTKSGLRFSSNPENPRLINNISTEKLNECSIPLTLNGKQVHINTYPAYITASMRSGSSSTVYCAVSLYDSENQKLACSAGTVISLTEDLTKVISGGMYCYSPYRNNPKGDLTSRSEWGAYSISTDFWFGSYVINTYFGENEYVISLTPLGADYSGGQRAILPYFKPAEIRSFDPDNPYDPAGPSTSGGGDGSFDNKSDPVDFTELPSLSVINSGFAGLFKPTLSQLNALANYLWNEDINFDQLKKLVANPIDLLISLTIMPVDPPTSGSESIKVGFIDTGISINKIENQYMAIDFGSLEVKEYYGNALDYSPYTKISIYLPYIGLKQLNTDDVMKKTLALRYNVDLFTGACVAEIKAGESVLYTFTGNIANQIPLNAESFNSFLSGLIQAAASVGVAIASHGTSVATQGAAEAGEATAMAARGAQTASNLASMNAALTSAGAVATSKPDILHSGSMTANNGYLSGKTPYLIYEVPRACIPENYQTFVGYPSNITKALSEVTGFTVVDSIHLENIPATDRELSEIERLLKGGVIL